MKLFCHFSSIHTFFNRMKSGRCQSQWKTINFFKVYEGKVGDKTNDKGDFIFEGIPHFFIFVYGKILLGGLIRKFGYSK